MVSLNPTWVEWLMGFPLGWTALEHSATRSSRRSRKSSGGRSSVLSLGDHPPVTSVTEAVNDQNK